MELKSPQKELYARNHLNDLEAQHLAEIIAFGPVIFQVSRLMIRFGVFQALLDSAEWLTVEEVAAACRLRPYAAQVLLEASLTLGTVLYREGRYNLSKVGFFLLKKTGTRLNLDFNHQVNYRGWFHLEEALLSGKPEGLKVFGDWPTIYAGLTQLPEEARSSWLAFDHYYSDCTFAAALTIVFDDNGARTLLDVGGNTGRWALQCVAHCREAQVTVMDLLPQLKLLRQQTADADGADRIHTHEANLLEPETPFPAGFDAIWMSQFLDCFAMDEVISILRRAAAAMTARTRLYILEPLWDRQRHETASFCLTQLSLYFAALANGNSKMFHTDELERCVTTAGLKVERIIDDLGVSHSLIQCVKL